MISVWHDEDYDLDFSGPDAQRQVAQVGEFNAALMEAGAFVFGAGLQPRAAAQVMRPDDSGVITVDGPYVESKEHIGGFWIIEAPDADAARTWATRAASACEQPVELRPLQA